MHGLHTKLSCLHTPDLQRWQIQCPVSAIQALQLTCAHGASMAQVKEDFLG